MKKNTVTEYLKFELDWINSVSIDQIRLDLIEIEKLGATHVSIDTEYGSSYVRFSSVKERPETDEEYFSRNKYETIRLNTQKANELRELKRLQEKYKDTIL